MKIEEFTSGTYQKRFQYECFLPNPVNQDWWWESRDLTSRLEKSVAALSALDASSEFVPNMDLFIRMHIYQEASASSRIEGTQTEMEEAVLPESAVSVERRDDWREVNNYVLAMNSSIEQLDKLPLSIRLLCGAHKQLLAGVRGETKMPGEIRTSQNWIGGASIATARYIPPAPELLPDLLSDLEKFWYNDQIDVSHLIRCAISHYQFETIHPFCDGNGRVGRLLIPFYLISKGVLHYPSLYISAFLERHRKEYYEALSRVRTENDLMGWILFFLEVVRMTATESREKFRKIFALRERVQRQTEKYGMGARSAQKFIRLLYSHPRISIREASDLLKMDYQTVNRLVHRFEKEGIVVRSTQCKRNAIYDFREYLDLFKN